MSAYGLCLRVISAGCISAFCRALRPEGCTGTTGDMPMPEDGGPFMSRPEEPEPRLAIASAAAAESIPIPPPPISPPFLFVDPAPKSEPPCWLSPPAKSCPRELPDPDPDPNPVSAPDPDEFEPIPPNNCIPSERSPSWFVG